MLTLDDVSLTDRTIETVAIDALGESHGVSREAARMYERFYGLRRVSRHGDDLSGMLASALRGALARLPDGGRRPGQLFFCKTQTHNTFADRSWLRRFADEHGLAHWEVGSLGMTSCASGLALVHFAHAAGAEEPLIVLTGEKAFHPSVARLSVGLLAEAPTAVSFNAGRGTWRILGTRVRHLPRFFRNPDAMDADDRRALQESYLPALTRFVGDSLAAYAPVLRDDVVFAPHNLNRPVTAALQRAFGWSGRTFEGDLAEQGHAYCSDVFLNLRAFERASADRVPPGTQLLALAAGTGVTFATCLLERADHA